MSVRHHPADHWILSLAAGSLDQAQAVVVSAHIDVCTRCRALFDRAEAVGGALLNSLAPAALSPGAFDRLMARIDGEEKPLQTSVAAAGAPGVSDLPAALRHLVPNGFDALAWRPLGPGLKGVRLPVGQGREDSRLWLLRGQSGRGLVSHSHRGAELTLVLKGAFRDESGRFGVGDIEDADGETHHKPRIEDGGECICLVAVQGMLRLQGLIPRLVQPFIGL